MANQRDRSVANDKAQGGRAVDFDDDAMVQPRGNVTGAGRSRDARIPSDAQDLGTQNVGMSDRNGPSDRDAKRDNT